MCGFVLGKKKSFPQIAAFGTLVPVEELQNMVEEAVEEYRRGYRGLY